MTEASTRLTAAQEADLQMRKRALRLSMNAIRDSLSVEHRTQGSALLATHIDSDAFRKFVPRPGGVIAGYIAIRSEIDPMPLMQALVSRGYALALPQLEGSDMVFRRWNIGDRLSEGPLRTREPLGNAPLVTPELVITPLLAFDTVNARLGYGMGCYDRFYERHPEIARIGVAFACQEVAVVPRAPHDTLLQRIFTETSPVFAKAIKA